MSYVPNPPGIQEDIVRYLNEELQRISADILYNLDPKVKAYGPISGNYTPTASDFFLNCTGTVTITLPTTEAGTEFLIKNSGTGRVTVAGTVDGKANQILLANDAIRIISTGSAYLIV